MNNEVIRLRQLRKTALKVRALALSLAAAERDGRGGVYARAAVLNWRIARITTGWLRSHPYESYQKGPGIWESAADRLSAHGMGTWAKYRGQGMHVFLAELASASRQLADARALTLSTELSDAFGRAQTTMQAIIDEVRLQIPAEFAQTLEGQGSARAASSRLSASPYIAL